MSQIRPVSEERVFKSDSETDSLSRIVKENVIQFSLAEKTEFVGRNNIGKSKKESDSTDLFISISQLREGIFKNEHWDTSVSIDAKILSINNDFVVCECLLDRDKMIFENMNLERILFDKVYNLKEEGFVCIKILKKPGSIRYDIFDGTGIVDVEKFDINSGWDDLRGFDFGKPISFE